MRTLIIFAAVVLQITVMAASGWSQAYTRIISPVQGGCVPGPDVKVQFEAGGITLAPGGYNLHFKLDDQPFQVQYNGNRAHVFKNVMPGTHTVRAYVANALHEAVPGTLSTVSFNVAHYDGANLPAPGAPLVTWNLPQGEYLGVDALDVTLDFMLSNATLSPGGLQLAYYVDGRRFLIQDNCYVRHIKDLAPGLHRIRIELQDANGDLVPGPFNNGERVIAISPTATTKTPSLIQDNNPRSPRIESIPGAMTLGGPRPQIVVPLTPEQIARQHSLTINKEGHTISLDGSVISEDLTEGRRPEDTGAVVDGEVPSAVPGPTQGFTVRPGGEPDQTVDLDSESDNIKRGSIVVKKPAEDADAEPDEAEPEPTTAEETKVEASATTKTAVRRRADGTTSTVQRTTETLRLGERPSLRQTTTETTRTVRANDAKSTAAKTPAPADKKSTATKDTSATLKKKSNDTPAAAPAADKKSTSTAASDAVRRRERGSRGGRTEGRSPRSAGAGPANQLHATDSQ